MKKFVVVVPDEFCPIGSILVDSHGINDSFGLEVFRDGDSTGTPVYTSWSSIRELDDSPIAAGDEVVCVDQQNWHPDRQWQCPIGIVKQVKEADIDCLSFDGKDWYPNYRFVKVKPQPAPEVKQEAAEPERPDPNETLIKQIRQRLNVEQDRNRSYRGTDDILKVLDSVLEHKHSKVVDTINSARLFQEDVLSFLRAFSLILETIGDGHTHREKEARLRGLICLVETAAKRLRERQMSDLEGLSYRMLDDVFRSDFPFRHYVDKARESELRATAAEKWLGAVKGVLTAEQVASLERDQGSDVPF